ncbi:ATP-binding cassette domain-containing protein [Ktedonosporobacter rubrisoli]|uniref:ATP-binding cassette domain-containing protein n=1 Tax=Ktedonosporobacter rubrisoli TaxID=2509675 RepID=A0A4P6JML6_KTERU|nr:ATP-binding cassette domain-containing protein [Ktedonosporobacter rubrisoli]QBD76383.1 ATP-binding cassette domain-containing protein [Ktedonosporobacter rubrisoli]
MNTLNQHDLAQVESVPRQAILQGSNISKRYGSGCPYCPALTGPEHNTSQCPVCGTVTACSGINFSIEQGEVLGLVGESGSGKSTLMQAVNLSLAVDSGELWYREPQQPTGAPIDLFTLDKYARRLFRNQRLGIVHQRPELGLNMRFTVGGNVAEKLLLAGWRHVGHIRERASELMELTELPIERIDDDPRTFSGGMLQRVQISKALASNPSVLLLDEVTSGLDLSVQARVLDVIKRIQWELQVTMLVVSHDLGVIKQLARRTMVMKNGHVVESGLTDQILEDPQHPYTQLLVSSAL